MIDLSAPLNRSQRARNGSIFAGTSLTTSPGAEGGALAAEGGVTAPSAGADWASAALAESPFVCPFSARDRPLHRA
jgi:hypothetical protein